MGVLEGVPHTSATPLSLYRTIFDLYSLDVPPAIYEILVSPPKLAQTRYESRTGIDHVPVDWDSQSTQKRH